MTDEKIIPDDLAPDFFPSEVTENFEMLECLADNFRGKTIKIKRKSDGERFIMRCSSPESLYAEHEYEVLSSLDSSGIPKAQGLYRNDNVSCMVREYVAGVPLDEYVLEHEMTQDDITKLCVRLCDILTYIHTRTKPVIHRDIKPQNIIITNSGEPVLVDFGDARHYSSDSMGDTEIVGTSFYAPPEQYGFAQTDTRSDIYSFGILMRWLLTGSVTENDRITVRSKRLEKAISKCVAFSPNDRYPSAERLKKDIIAAENNKFTIDRTTVICAACLLLSCVALALHFIQPSERLPKFRSFDKLAPGQYVSAADIQEDLPNDVIGPKIIMKTSKLKGDWDLHIETDADLYVDWGDGNIVPCSNSDWSIVHERLGDTVRLYANGDINGFYCWSNAVTDIDVSRCPELAYLQFDDNRMTSIDLSHNPNITELTCAYNGLESMTFSKDCILTNLVCNDNMLDFTDLPIVEAMDGGMYECGNQGSMKINPILVEGGTLDLSQFAEFGGVETNFTWLDADSEEEVSPEMTAPGKFVFGEEFTDRRFFCRITNSFFPALVLDTDSMRVVRNAE